MSNKRFRSLLVVLCLLATLVIAGSMRVPAVEAANITVNTLADNSNGGDGHCTLREAINNSNADGDTSGGDCAAGSGSDSISFRISGIITLSSALPTLATTVTVNGTGQTITLDGAGKYPILRINGGSASVTLTALTLSNAVCNPKKGGGAAITNFAVLTVNVSTFRGNAAGYCAGGGAINNEGGTLNVNNSTFSNNSAVNAAGGAILNSGSAYIYNSTFKGNNAENGGAIYNFNEAALTVSSSTFKKNTEADYGAGIFNDGGSLTVSGSAFAGNETDFEGYGGGIANRNGTANITTSTFSKNYAKRGGGIYNKSTTINVTASAISNNEGWGAGGGLYNTEGTMVVTNSTVAFNETRGEFGGGFYSEYGALYVVYSTIGFNGCICDGNGAGGIEATSGTVTLSNTIMAADNETGFYANCNFWFNITIVGTTYANDNTCFHTGPGTQPIQVTDDQLNLGDLQNNGGLTQTIKPGAGSVVFDTGNAAECVAPIGAPSYGAGSIDQRGVKRPQGIHCDVGAYEVRYK